MTRSTWIALLLVCSGSVTNAQFDLGVAAGGYGFTIRPKANYDSYYKQAYSPGTSPLPCVSLIYAERKALRGADLTFQLDYMYKEFHAITADGGHGSAYGRDVDLRLHLLYLTAAPDIYLSKRKGFALRVGAQAGFLLTGHERGYKWSNGVFPYRSDKEEVNGPSSAVRGDLRVHFGARFMPHIKGKQRMLLDLFGNMAFMSMVRSVGGSRGWDYGVRVGYVLRCAGKPFTSLLDSVSPK